MHFGSDPPLFSKPKNWPAQAAPAAQAARPPAYASPYGGYPNGMAAAGGGDDVYHAHNPLVQPSGGSFQGQPSGSSAYSGASFSSRPPGSNPPSMEPPAGSGGMDEVWAAMMVNAGQQGAAAQPAAQPKPPPPQPPKENPAPKLAAAFRTAAAAALNRRLHASLTAIAQQAAAEGEEQLQLQATLRQRGEQLQSEVAALQVGVF